MTYVCRICKCQQTSMSRYLTHLKVHRHMANVRYNCCADRCHASFVVYSSLCAHVSRCHRNRHHHTSSHIVHFTDSGCTVMCSIPYCRGVIKTMTELLIHVRKHIREDKVCMCPFKNCTREFTNGKTFSAHASRKHRNSGLRDLKCEFIVQNSDAQHSTNDPDHSVVTELPSEVLAVADDTILSVVSDGVENDSDDVCMGVEQETVTDCNEVMKTFGLFCLKLQCKQLVPATTVQAVVDEFAVMQCNNVQYMLWILQKHLNNLGVSKDKQQEIFKDITESNPYSSVSAGPLRSIASRNIYYRNNFQYVSPVEISFGYNDDGERMTMHYIPVMESLKTLYANNRQSILFGKPKSTEGHYSDVHDGSVFKGNCLIGENEDCFGLILYQDSFEIVNPLGSGKKKHKLFAVYYTLANIRPENRSQIDHMQLVILCKETIVSAVGLSRIFAKMVQDMQRIEETGIEVEDGRYVRGTIICVVGDNLGSHAVGGFTENFSSSEYFCRFCMLTRQEFNSCPYAHGRFRTPQNYAESLQFIQENAGTAQHNGIRLNSPLNSLKYFHVCQPGLPPCLGHDIFEGVVAYDVAIYVKYFIKVKHWFSYPILARRVKRFKFLGCDNLDRPPVITENADRLSGHAVQNWILLRFFPLIIGSLVKDSSDPVWQLVLLLRRITDIVCAPSVVVAQVCILNGLLEDYVEQRHEQFPDKKLRPKHHYMLHYAQLILNFGPLIRVWTMRFESKHSFFKRCFRRLQNCKNVTKMLSEKHQLLQSYYTGGSLFPADVSADSSKTVKFDQLSSNLQCVVTNSGLVPQISDIITYKVAVSGTEYCRDMFVFIRREAEVLIAGRIHLGIVTAQMEIFFLVDMHSTALQPDLNVYRLCDMGVSECVPYHALLDYYPLYAYNFDGPVIVLKHAV